MARLEVRIACPGLEEMLNMSCDFVELDVDRSNSTFRFSRCRYWDMQHTISCVLAI